MILCAGVERDVEETGGATEALVMLAKLYDPKGAVRFSIAFEAFKNTQAAGDRFAADMQRRLFPETETASHKDVLRFLQFDHGLPFFQK